MKLAMPSGGRPGLGIVRGDEVRVEIDEQGALDGVFADEG